MYAPCILYNLFYIIFMYAPCILYNLFYIIFMYAPCNLYNLLFRPTNTQYINSTLTLRNVHYS